MLFCNKVEENTNQIDKNPIFVILSWHDDVIHAALNCTQVELSSIDA